MRDLTDGERDLLDEQRRDERDAAADALAGLVAREAQLVAQYRSAQALAYNAAQMRRARGVGTALDVQRRLEREIDRVRAAIRAHGDAGHEARRAFRRAASSAEHLARLEAGVAAAGPDSIVAELLAEHRARRARRGW